MLNVLKKLVLVHLIFCVALALAYESVLLKGTITDSTGKGLADATVKLKKFPNISAKTDANGAFTLTGNTGIIHVNINQGLHSQYTIQMLNNGLMVTTRNMHSDIEFNLYNSRGSRIYSSKFKNAAAGNYMIPFNVQSLAQGIYYCNIIADGAVSVTPVVISGGNIIGGVRNSTTRGSTMPNLHASANAVIDTLLILKPGYKNRFISLSEYVKDGLACSSRVSNTWKPNGSLEKEKGMVKIKAKGYDFEMGYSSPKLIDLSTENEMPVHTVSFTYDYWLDSVEVSQGKYDSIMKLAYPNHYKTKPDWLPKFGMGAHYPTYYVCWGSAALYANALSKLSSLDTVYSYTSVEVSDFGRMADLEGLAANLSKNGYRLPTEAEWEYASRAGSATDYFWGKNAINYPSTAADSAEISSYCAWEKNARDMGAGQPGFGTHQVGSHKPNAYGLYDMIGNVSEWVHDVNEAYKFGPVTDPMGPSTGARDSQRGGNWGNGATYLRPSCRTFDGPEYPFNYWGFRVARPIK